MIYLRTHLWLRLNIIEKLTTNTGVVFAGGTGDVSWSLEFGTPTGIGFGIPGWNRLASPSVE